MSRLHEFRVLQGKIGNSGAGAISMTRWVAPSVGCFKVNVDGSFFQASEKGSTGFVVRDWQGSFIAGGGKSLSGLLSPEHVEVVAYKQAIEFVVTNHYLPAIVETDSQLVYRQLLSREGSNLSILGRVYDDMEYILDAYANLCVVHTKRSANRVAHLMAAHTRTLPMETFYFSSPSFLQAALVAEVV
ncbi:uncharacterized protein LOC133722798 [Rosa rugosa]|uniref:uncharacterized protein LOC133722798 n=1 Tax=Rosa rugosa TaxID=74645 RepID=UPI002B412D03|nr:uncharacterized protein LOC133722798 [Rosa rugosa]